MRKLFFPTLIAVIALVMAIPSIAQTLTVDGIKYSYDIKRGSATLIDGKSCSGAVEIPLYIIVDYRDENGTLCSGAFYIHNIGDSAFYECTAITSVTVPNSIGAIGASAFQGCTGLTSFATGVSVHNIGDSAFRGCTGLTSITFEDKVETIGNYAFSGCTALTSITYTGKIVSSIGSYAFSGCTGLTSVTIPETVTSIGANAFGSCDNLKRVDITDLTAWCNIDFGDDNDFGEGAFPKYSLYLGNKMLTYMDIPDGVTEIKQYVFYNCTGLISVTIPKSVTSVGNFAFAYCNNLKINIYDLAAWCNIDFGMFVFPKYTLYLDGDQIENLAIPDGITEVKGWTFYNCTGFTSVTFSGPVTKICKSAFERCTGLTSVTIPNTVKTIEGAAFLLCENLNKVYISDLTVWMNIKFGDNAFPPYSLYLGNTPVTDLAIPDGITEIKPFVFQNCTSITSVKIPETVTSISNRAFYCYRCDNLKNVYSLNTTPPAITNDTFSSYAATLHVPAGSSGLYKSKEYWKNFSNIEETQAAIDNVMADSEEQLPAEYYNLSGIRVMTVPSGEAPVGLAAGIYIVRRGSLTEKVAVR